ncbi:MAG TPA: VOC family protein [Jatrophihabitans sp.]|nr:VOC family protein [Jatrophihabitans sp.]
MSEIRGLGYLKVQTADLPRWRSFALEGIGWATGSGPDPDGLYLRMDERQARLVLVPGAHDRVLAVGWEVRDGFALDRVRAAVEAAGTETATLSEDDADERGAEAVITFRDPAGTPVEVYFGPVLDHSPVITPYGSRFVTGPQGMGHVVLPTMRFEETYAFYTEVLGFRPRGAIRMGGPKARPRRRVRFLGVNERHHSLAVVPAPHGEAPGLVHMMVEVDTLDAVGQALDRLTKLGFSISSTLGRHTNDKMVSFYVRAPGGWDIELGFDGLRVDETHYTAEEITADSYWGHDWAGTEPLAAFLPPPR